MAPNKNSFCHVFLSFKGETRNSFTCFLNEALEEAGFETFMDKEDIRVGDEVDMRIKNGIRGSMSAIIVFSQNYAYSTWCLNELLLILERKRTSRYFIIPVFHGVEPADIKHQLGSYGAALEKHKKRHNDKVEKWRQALGEVGNILGHNVEGMQSIFIRKMVTMFRQKMLDEFPEMFQNLPKSCSSVSQNHVPLANSTSSSSYYVEHDPPTDKIVLYTLEKHNGCGSNDRVRFILRKGNVAFEERNCSKEPRFKRELENLVGREEVKFPMVIVNGKDVCGDDDVEGLEGFEGFQLKQKLKETLFLINIENFAMQKNEENMRVLASLGRAYPSRPWNFW